MKTRFENVYGFYFSPAGSTARIVNRVAGRIADELKINILERRFTVPQTRLPMMCSENEILVIGMPTYAGRLPNKIVPYIKESVRGEGTIAIPIVTFGNRSFDSSMDELITILKGNGFKVPSAIAVPCRHVFSKALGEGRPDECDMKRLDAFAEKTVNLLTVDTLEAEVEAGEIAPYYIPLKEDGTPAKFLRATPKTDIDKCYMCGHCVEVCPMGVINREDCVSITGPCIKCHACVVRCPSGAKFFDDPDFLSHVKMLEQNYMKRKEITEIYG